MGQIIISPNKCWHILHLKTQLMKMRFLFCIGAQIITGMFPLKQQTAPRVV